MQTRSKSKEKVNASFDQALKHFLDQERAKGQDSRNKRQPRKRRPQPMAQLPRNEEAAVEKPLKDYSTPSLTGFRSPIAPPGVDAPQFELKTALINMVGNTAFSGIGNPNAHLTSFLEICETFKINNVPKEAIYLRLFPFSLMGKAKDWLWSHDASTFTTWNELAQAFLLQYFPPAKTQRLKNLINSFKQGEDETFYEAWERFMELQRESAGGAFIELHPTNAGAIIDKIVRNSHYWGSDRNVPSALHVKQSQKQPRVCAICTNPSYKEDDCPHILPQEENQDDEDVNFMQRNQPSYGRDRDHPNFSYKMTELIKYDPNWRQKNNAPPGFTSKNQDYQGQGYQRQVQQGQSSQVQQRTQYQPKANYQGYQQQGNYQGMSPQQPQAPTHQSAQDQSMTDILANLVANQAIATANQAIATANQAKAAQDNAMMYQALTQRMDEMSTHSKMFETQLAQQASSSSRQQGKLPS
ncbi:unnamed protein product [Rhodiola kirilowii]